MADVNLSGTRLEALLRDLLGCLCVKLGEAGWEGDCCLEPGAVAFDQCCKDAGNCGSGGGKAWARLVDVHPGFPLASDPVDPSRDDVGWGVEVELGALTCNCFEMCDCEVREANAARALRMAAGGLQALTCCELAGCGELKVGGLTMVGPEGDCNGFVAQVVVAMDVCCAS